MKNEKYNMKIKKYIKTYRFPIGTYRLAYRLGLQTFLYIVYRETVWAAALINFIAFYMLCILLKQSL
jgi:hypothetical protein